MPESRFGPAAAALVLACMAELVAACGADGEESKRPTADARPSTADPGGATAPATEPAPTPTGTGSAGCSTAQRRAARNIWLWQAVGEVTGAPTGVAVRARDTVARHTAKAETRLLAKCGGHVPKAFQRFSTDLRPTLAKGRLGDPELDEVLAAWLRWASAAGAPEGARREVRDLASCRREFFPRFDASYRVWWKWTETGKAWWVTITFDNRTGKVLDGDMGGTAKATKLLEDPFGWEQGPRPGPGKNATLSWRGSSAEVLELQPGRTELTAAPDIDQDVHTTADGTFRVIEMSAGLMARGERYGCSPPISPMP